jgi:hypothetical protein
MLQVRAGMMNGNLQQRLPERPHMPMAFCSRLLMALVAPSDFASSRRDGTTSTAKIAVAPVAAAARIALKPTAPAPKC